MPLVQRGKRPVFNGFETIIQQFGWFFAFISRAFVKTVVAGCCTQNNDQLCRILHPDLTLHIADRSASMDHLQAAFKGHAKAFDLMIVQKVCCSRFTFPSFFVQFGILVLVTQFFHQIKISAKGKARCTALHAQYIALSQGFCGSRVWCRLVYRTIDFSRSFSSHFEHQHMIGITGKVGSAVGCTTRLILRKCSSRL